MKCIGTLTWLVKEHLNIIVLEEVTLTITIKQNDFWNDCKCIQNQNDFIFRYSLSASSGSFTSFML